MREGSKRVDDREREERNILSLYMKELDVFMAAYNMMGKLLDLERVEKQANMLLDDDVYIYGGGYLGIQLYRALRGIKEVKSIVDSTGMVKIRSSGIPVISRTELEKVYQKENVIITPVQYYKTIYEDLLSFVPEDRMLLLGEFLWL